MGYYNGKKVLSVASVEYLTPRGQIKLTENGSYDVEAYKKAVVAVFPSGTIQTIEDEGVAQGAGAFPSTTLPKGLINYVGGMSQKVNQLVRLSNETITRNGCTFVSNANGVISLSGTPSTNSYFSISLPIKSGHKYLFRLDNNNIPAGVIRISDQTSPSVFGGYFPISTNKVGIATAVGTNLSASIGIWVSTSFDGNNISFRYQCADLTDIYGAGNEPTSTSDPRIQWLIRYLKNNPQYNEGSIVNAKVTNLLSIDGTESNYPIPAEVQALDGYGLGYSATLFNKTDLENKVFVKRVNKVSFSNLSAQAVTYQRYIVLNIPDDKTMSTKYMNSNPNIIDTHTSAFGYNDDQIRLIGAVDGLVLYAGSSHTFNNRNEATTFLNSLVGDIIYETNETTETDISEYLDRDFPNENLIDLYADGKVYFENENDMGVPYSLTYQERIN